MKPKANPTIIDVAKAAGVSRATAARALGRYGYVSEKTAKAVQEAAEKLKYRPNELAKSMITRKTQTVGLVVADIQNPFFAGIARGVSDTLADFGYNLIVSSTNEDLDEERKTLEFLCRKQLDGLIVSPASSKAGEHINAMAQQVPIVLIDRLVDDSKLDVVTVNNREGAYQAVKYLLKFGHRKIGFLGGHYWISSDIERFKGYEQALTEAKISVDSSLVRMGSYTSEAGLSQAISLLTQDNRPTAVFSAHNFLTVSLLLAMKKVGLHAPEDMSVVAFDSMEWLEIVTPPITTVAQPVYELGQAASKVLLNRISGDTSPTRITRLQVDFIERESVKSLT